jgi:hypothetical protein
MAFSYLTLWVAASATFLLRCVTPKRALFASSARTSGYTLK